VSRPKLLDLFSCAGGAGYGYSLAGFDVYAVDIERQPRNPFPFYQGDAVEALRILIDGGSITFRHTDGYKDGRVEALALSDFDAIHASPPCQAFSAMKHMPDAKDHPELIEPTRELLERVDVPWVIENVIGAPLNNAMVLCGTMFGLGAAGFSLQRHRQFETNFDVEAPGECNHAKPTIGIYGGHVRCRSTKFWRNTGADFPGYDKKALAIEAMGGTHWMTMNQMSEAIPPAYTEHVGRYMQQLIATLDRTGYKDWDFDLRNAA
jgi:DNA (cytosine-5)-methyltransferase 1